MKYIFLLLIFIGCNSVVEETPKEKEQKKIHRIRTGRIITKIFNGTEDCSFIYENSGVIDTINVSFTEFQIAECGDTITLNKIRK